MASRDGSSRTHDHSRQLPGLAIKDQDLGCPQRLLSRIPTQAASCFPKNLSTMNIGGLSPPEPATPEIQGIAQQVKNKLEAAANKRFATYKAILYCAQVVAGMNYFIKMRCGDKEKDYVHLRIFQALPVQGGLVELSSFQLDKTKDDPITYF
ncbi:leukocyte cysteine proteinase inhibitor 1-like [Pantherophis guttatus]|uniref:Leukocyte cysteine proteinase inhibitor 1-like n=1 Tax=Pantherophis guttatus TaxID=94885 RepID=A0A6P9CG24_PANGU|nr:leukocyte cysteine proteinase inhibitor 1-like [Pantherophis guttatus]